MDDTAFEIEDRNGLARSVRCTRCCRPPRCSPP
jgi:hypothetical protein